MIKRATSLILPGLQPVPLDDTAERDRVDTRKSVASVDTVPSTVAAHDDEGNRSTLDHPTLVQDNEPDIFPILWRRKGLLSACVLGVTALVLGAAIYKGPSYAATAVVQLDLRTSEPTAIGAAPPSAAVDAAVLVEGQSRIISSDEIARRVVERMGLDQLEIVKTGVSLLEWAGLGNDNSGERRLLSRIDQATSRLLQKITIKTDPRTYLISVSATSKDPEEAAVTANTVVGEYLHYAKIQKLVQQVTTANQIVSGLSAMLGPRHPKMMNARVTLDAAMAQLNEAKSTRAPITAYELAASGQVIPARAVTIPVSASDKSLLIISVIGGLLLGLLLVAILERWTLRNFILHKLGHGPMVLHSW